MNEQWASCILGAVLLAFTAAPASAGPLTSAEVGASMIEWRLATEEAGLSLTLTVSGPDGFYLQRTYAVGEAPAFSVFDEAGEHRPVGTYVWEIRAGRQLGEGTRRDLEASRDSGDGAVLGKLAGLAGDDRYETGSFSIVAGQIVAGGAEESRAAEPGKSNTLSTKVVLTNANGVIRNALCVGADCPDAPAFGDSSVLMMENNNRIKFGDTSVSPFPNNDWEIEANSSVSGGQSYLGFNDCGTADNDGDCATDLVFAVEAGVRASALYVESDGDVGLGTANPVLDLHIVTGNTPSLRLEQDTSSGFGAQSWDIAGNETSFFIRDVTGGSTLPFRIFPGAASNSLIIDDTDSIGVGTVSPASTLHVRRADGTTQLQVEEASGTTAGRVLFILRNNGAVRFNFENSNTGASWQHQLDGSGNFDINSGAGGQFELQPDGDLTISGTLTTGGVTCGGGCDRVFHPDYELETIEEHASLMWSNSYLPAVGPTREGEPFNLSEKTGGILNELEKAHIYIESLHHRIAEQEREQAQLRDRLELLETHLSGDTID